MFLSRLNTNEIVFNHDIHSVKIFIHKNGKTQIYCDLSGN